MAAARARLGHHALQRALVQFAREQPVQQPLGLAGRREHLAEQPPPLGLSRQATAPMAAKAASAPARVSGPGATATRAASATVPGAVPSSPPTAA